MIKLYNGNGGEVEITPSDDSYRLTELMGADEVVLKFALPDYLAISAGSYITYKGDRYEVESEDSVRMIHTEEYEYTVTFSSPRAHLRRYIVREKGDEGRITFFLTAKPREHLELIVHNLNEREAGWSVGACLDGSEKTIEYSTTNALDALQKLAEAYGTEWECEGRTISLRKSEYHKDSPLTVSYGKGKGLLSGLERNPAEEQPVGTLYVTGTDRNIDPAKYKSKTLHLPEGATRAVGGRTYTVTSGGRAITVSGSAPGAVEGAFTDTDIYPSREGVVKTVTIRDKEKAFVDFTDPTIPADLDFEKCLIPGREMKLTFQTGMLAGRTFGAKYVHKDRRFEIVPEEIDGVLMPSAPFLPKEGDRYGVFEIALPDSYISAAEGRLLDSAVQYLDGLETSRYSYRAAVDPLWLKKQWTKVGHKVRIGAYVRLAGDPITDGGATLRITGIKEYLTDPYAPEVTLSDRATGRGGLTSIIRKAVQEDLTSTREASTRTAVEQARRTFHKAEQLTDALEKALGAHFEAMVRPLAVHTMQVLVGDKSLQFAYVESKSSTKEVPLPLTYDTATKSLHIDRAYLQHKTLGVEVTTAHTAKDFRTWTIAPTDYSPKGTAPLYLYARVPREGDGGTFVIDTKAHDFEEEAGWYHLWSGMLTPTDDGTSWEYMPMHGFTEITPGMISSPRFTSPDGRLVIDMVKGYFRFKTDKSTLSINADNPDGVYIRGGMISVGGQNLTMEEAFEKEQKAREAATAEAERKRAELEEALEGLRKSTGDEQAAMAEILGKVNKTLTSLQEQVDNEVSNWFYPGAPGPDKEPENEWITNQDKYRHIGDTYTSVDESGEYMGKSWRYTTEYKWQEIHDTLISKALAVAAKAQTTADGKSTTYYTQPSRYSVGDSWVLSSDTTVGGKVYKKGTMLFANSSSDVYVGAHWSDILKYIDSAKLEADLKASEKRSKEAWEAYAAAKASKAGEDAVKAAKEYAEAQDAAYEERTRAYADKILTEKEQALIAAADAKANLAEERAKAYADGKITATEQLAIDKAAAAYKAAVKKAKELDGEIQVGGRNLVIMSRMIPGYLYGESKIDRNPGAWNYKVIQFKDFIYDPTYYEWDGASPLTFKLIKGGMQVPIIHFHDKDKVFIDWSFSWDEKPAGYTQTLTPKPETAYIRIGFPCADPLVKLERGAVATDWTPAPEDVQSEIDAAKEQATKAQTSTDKLRGYVDGAFRDGVVDDAEAKAIKTYINEVDAQWQSALGAYEKVYTNALLTGAPKTALLDCKTTLAGKCDDLTQYIATAIADGRATSAEVNGVNSRYNAYKVALRDFQKALKEAEDYIRSKGSGGKYLGEANALSYDGGVQLESGRFVYGKAGDTVRMTNTGSNSITSWEKGKVYILVLTTDKGYELLVWVTLTGRDGKDGAPGKKGDKGDKGDGLEVVDTRNDNQPPSWYRRNYRLTTVREFKVQSVIEIPSRWIYAIYCTLETTVRWADTSGGRVEQSTTLDNGTQLRRVGTADDSDWEPWINITAQVQEINQGLANANTSIAALKKAKEEIEKGKLSAGDLPAHLKWIYKAFNEGETIKEGGLVLTQIIGLSNIDGKITAYISGRNAKGAHMLAAGVSSLADTDAVSYINYDGSTKFGQLRIDKDGEVSVVKQTGTPSDPDWIAMHLSHNRLTFEKKQKNQPWADIGGSIGWFGIKDGRLLLYSGTGGNLIGDNSQPLLIDGGIDVKGPINNRDSGFFPVTYGMCSFDTSGRITKEVVHPKEKHFQVKKLDTGYYKITLPDIWMPSVMLIGNACASDSKQPLYCSFSQGSYPYNEWYCGVADDSSRNDPKKVSFIVIGME